MGMDRMEEMVSGNISIIGDKKVLNNIFYHIVQSCRTREGKTFVLCPDASKFGGEEQNIVRMGCHSQNNEVTPDFLEPFFRSPTIGVKLEYIVSTLTEMFFANNSVVNTNDQFFIGTAEILFSELIKYSLLILRKHRKCSFSDFASYYAAISNEFPKMIAHSEKNTSLPYSYSNRELERLSDEHESPFANTLIASAPHTANSVEGTMRTNTAKMGDFMSTISRAKSNENGGDERECFSFLKHIKDSEDGIIFIQPGSSFYSYRKVIFRFVCENMKLIAEIFPNTDFRFVIPDICFWREPTVLSSLLENAPDNLSIVWGASNMRIIEQAGRSNQDLGTSLISTSTTQVWGRSGDAASHRIYQELVPETLRTYRLSQIPEQLCFIKSEKAEFDSAEIPKVPELMRKTQEMSTQVASEFWIDGKDEGKNERRKMKNDADDKSNKNNDDDDILSGFERTRFRKYDNSEF